ncbi:hypothetical protein ACUH93_03835 [Dermabacteraceae bacterium P7006]
MSASLTSLPENPFDKCDGPFYVDQRDPGSPSNLAQGDFHFLFGKGKAVTVPAMEWTVKVIPVPNNDNKIQRDQDRDVWVEGYEVSNLGSAVAFSRTTGNAAETFISPYKKKATKASDGSYTVKFTTKEVTDTRANQVRSYGFKVYTGGASKLISRRADKVVIEGRPLDAPKTSDGQAICEPGTRTPMARPLWVDYDTIENASRDKRWTNGLSESENRRRGWSQQEDGRV